jgi:predicted PurR-regulated permease PerM
LTADKGDGQKAREAAAEEPGEGPADVAEQEAPVATEGEDFGEPGRPLSPRSPFVMGFFGAAGALAAYWLGTRLLGIGSVLILIVVAFFLAVGLNPAVEWLMRRGLPRAWAVVVVISVVMVALAVFVFALVPVITDQAASLGTSAPGWFDQLQNNKRVQRLDDKYDVVAKLQQYVTSGDLTQRVFGGVVGVGLAILGFLANAFLVLVMMLYFLATLPRVKKSLYRLAPASRRDRVTKLGDQILQGIGAYVSGAFVVALCAGVTTLIFLVVIGLGEYAVALALVVALLDVIPMIGATIGAVLVCAIGFATDVHTGIALVIFYLVYQQLENYVIYPRVMSHTVDISGLLTVIAALIGASLLGVVGALMAIPTAAAMVLLVNEVFVRRQDAR